MVLQNVEQFITNKIKKTELTEVFNQKLTSEKLIRKELRYLSINSNSNPDFMDFKKEKKNHFRNLNIQKSLYFSRAHNVFRKSRIKDYLKYISLSELMKNIDSQIKLSEVFDQFIE